MLSISLFMVFRIVSVKLNRASLIADAGAIWLVLNTQLAIGFVLLLQNNPKMMTYDATFLPGFEMNIWVLVYIIYIN